MRLVIDIGNTFTKIAVFKGDEIDYFQTLDALTLDSINKLALDFPQVDTAILAKVKSVDEQCLRQLKKHFKLLILDHQTKLPFTSNYETPKTLGRDRVAAVAGALELIPDKNILIIDAGTCITYDMITADKVYLGGGISPGLKMRFDALHTFTGKLPLIKAHELSKAVIIGDTTENSILSGVKNGILAEVDGIIYEYQKLFQNLKIIITGGDYKYFDKYLKNNIFAAPNLVLIGLKKILDFNEGN